MGPGSQDLQLRRAGVPLENLYRDAGTTGTQECRAWHQLNDSLAGGDTLAAVAIDCIGRRWPDILKAICELRARGVKVRSLADAEKGMAQYRDADPDTPEALFGQVLTIFAAWVANQARYQQRLHSLTGRRRHPTL